MHEILETDEKICLLTKKTGEKSSEDPSHEAEMKMECFNKQNDTMRSHSYISLFEEEGTL